MESSTPLTRCSTCQTVFEVPQSILDSVDSRVRCGECLTIFDASENLHLVDRPDLTIPEPTAEDASAATGNETEAGQPRSAAEVAGIVEGAMQNFASTSAGDSVLDSSSTHHSYNATEASSSALDSDESEGGQAEAATGTAHGVESADVGDFDQTQVEMELFSEDADLPVADFEDSTIDAIRLDFDVVDDFADETLSQTMFEPSAKDGGRSTVSTDSTDNNDSTLSVESDDSTRDLSGSIEDDNVFDMTADATASPDVDDDSDLVAELNSRRRAVRLANANFPGSANTGFSLDDGGNQPIVEFDFRSESSADDPKTATQDVEEESISTALTSDDSQAVAIPELKENSAQHAEKLATRAKAEEQTQRNAVDKEARRSGGNLGRWVMRVFLALGFVALLASLYTLRHRNHLADNPITRPGYTLWCLAKGCEVPPRLDTTKLAVVSKQIFSHPTIENALVITLVIRNTADFEQRFPKLFLWLSDRGRRTVASNEFDPSEYLPENNMLVDAKLGAGEQQRISLDVLDPGDDAVSLELTFR